MTVAELTAVSRTETAATTWARVQSRLAEFGISRVADVTGLDDIGIPVYLAIRPAARTLTVAQGKGIDAIAAKLSAVMEAIEHGAAEQYAPDHVFTARPDQLHLPYDPADLPLATRSLLGPGTAVAWVNGTSQASGDAVPVPLECVTLSSVVTGAWHPPLFLATSTGLASGNTDAEATLHALYEIVERDALTQLQDPGATDQLDLDTLSGPAHGLAQRIHAAGCWLELLQVRSRFSIPVMVAHLWSPSLPVVCSGSGAHHDPATAMVRALTEAAQTRLACITGTRDDLTPDLYTPRPASSTCPTSPRRRPTAAPAGTPDIPQSIEEQVAVVAAAIAQQTGTSPITIRLTGQAWPAVVKVIAPGAVSAPRHFLPRQP
jgi:ribosomal protein S12 methylthiotransferase accessory factor